MSYQVFARKYRPLTFDDVLGQDHVVKTLKNAIENNRLAHAYLFVGPRGTGKTSTARIFAKALNCSNGPRVDFDPHETLCEEIAEGRSLDVLEIDGASNRGIDHIRELRDSVRYAPAKGKFRIVYIDEVHMLTSESFNALLKTLEEPPPHVKFIFATTEPHKILPTILSRCQRFDLRPIPTEVIAEHLLNIAANEGVSLSKEAAFAVAKVADGGMRDAQSMLDQLVSFCGSKIEEQQVLQIFGITSRDTVAKALKHLIKKELPDLLHLLHDQAEAGRDMGQFLSEIISAVREILVAKVDPDATFDALPESSRAELSELVKKTQADKILRLVEVLAETEDKMRWSTNKRLHLEMGLIKAVHALAEASISDIIMALDGAPLPPQGLAHTSTATENTPTVEASSPVTPQTVQEPPPAEAVQPAIQTEQQPSEQQLTEQQLPPTQAEETHDLMDPVPDFSTPKKQTPNQQEPTDTPPLTEPEPTPLPEQPEQAQALEPATPSSDYIHRDEESEPSPLVKEEETPYGIEETSELPTEAPAPVAEPGPVEPARIISAISDAPVSLPDNSIEPEFMNMDPEEGLAPEFRTASFYDDLLGLEPLSPAASTAKNTQEPQVAAPTVRTLTEQDWQAAVERASAQFPVMSGCLNGAVFGAHDGVHLNIKFHPNDRQGIDSLTAGMLKTTLEADLAAIVGRDIFIIVQRDASLPEPVQEELLPLPAPERPTAPIKQQQEKAPATAVAPPPPEKAEPEDNSYYDDPLIQSALNKFRGRIIKQ